MEMWLQSVVLLFLVPDYLRTKYDPEIEESEQKLETIATNIPPEQAQVKRRRLPRSQGGRRKKNPGNEVEKTPM